MTHSIQNGTARFKRPAVSKPETLYAVLDELGSARSKPKPEATVPQVTWQKPIGFQLKGKTDPTSIVEILGRHDTVKAEHRDLCERFAEALAAFQRKEWHRAMSLFEAIATKYDQDRTSHFYWSCSQRYALEPPVHAGPVSIQMSEK